MNLDSTIIKTLRPIFITEKILKPIINLHPFILVENHCTLKKMREYGFKTFTPFIDESYDEIGDTTQRFRNRKTNK